MTGVDLELLDGEQLLSEVEELALRQIAPHMYVDGGKIATSAFGPNSSDANKPSYSRSSIVTPQQARDWHSANAPSHSLGVYGVSVGEVLESGRHVVDDSACPVPEGRTRAPGHCFVDIRGLDRPQRRELRAKLYMHAMARGELPTEDANEDGQLFA